MLEHGKSGRSFRGHIVFSIAQLDAFLAGQASPQLLGKMASACA
jgi:hypothetical protein